MLTRDVYKSNDPTVRIHRRSHISSFVTCPSRLVAEEKHDSGIDPIARHRGLLFHGCAEYVLKSQMAGWNPDAVDVEPVITQGEVGVRDEVRAMVKSWRNRWRFAKPLEVEALATSVILRPDESPDGLTHMIGGRIDLQVERAVWDWKTAYKILSQEQSEDDIQCGSYAILASDRYNWSDLSVNVAFVRWGVTRTVRFDLKKLLEWQERLKLHILNFLQWEKRLAEADPEEKNPGPHCGTCPILARCESAAPATVVNIEDANLMGGQLAKISKQSPAMKEALVAWLLDHPDQRVQVGDRFYGLGLSGSNKVEDAEAFVSVCDDLGITDFWRCLSVDSTKLKALKKKHPRLEAAIADLIVDRRKPALVPIKEAT